MRIVWTAPENPAHFVHASLGEGRRRIATLGRTAQGVILCIYPNGGSGDGRNHRVASIAQGKRFLERWLAVHTAKVASAPPPSGQPLWSEAAAS